MSEHGSEIGLALLNRLKKSGDLQKLFNMSFVGYKTMLYLDLCNDVGTEVTVRGETKTEAVRIVAIKYNIQPQTVWRALKILNANGHIDTGKG